MNRPLKVAKNLTLPLDAVTKTISILAMRGMGKSYAASVMAEQMLKAGAQVVIVDLLGVFWGLRSSEDGRHDGLPIPIFGGDHADVPLDASSGKTVADLVVNERLSVVLDLSRMQGAEAARFVLAFAEQLFHRNRKPMHLILDEADAWAPQKPLHGKERLLGAIEEIVRRGRVKGIGITLVTQRSAVLNKNVLSQSDMLILLRTVAPQDIKAIDAWVQSHSDKEQRDLVMGSLSSLKIGEAWFWSPGWMGMLKRAQVNHRETFDSSATPKMGVRVREPKRLSTVDLARIKDQIATTIEHAKQEDPRELRMKIVHLESELARVVKVKMVHPEVIPTIVEKVKLVEVKTPFIKEKDLKRLEKVQWEFKHAGVEVRQWAADLDMLIDKMMTMAQGARGQANKAVAPQQPGLLPDTRKSTVPSPQPPAPSKQVVKYVPGKDVDLSARTVDAKKLCAGERKMIQVLHRVHPNSLTRGQLATLSGIKITGGSFRTYLSGLRTFGFIQETGDTVSLIPENVTEDYRHLLSGTPISRAEVLNMWNAKLCRGERSMLEILLKDRKDMTREELSELSAISMTGGSFRTYLSKLRSNGLIEEVNGMVRITDTLFLGAVK